MTAILPVNIDFPTWTAQLRNSYPTEDIPQFVSSEKDWNIFPSMLLSNNCFDTAFIPRSEGFDNWRDWASQFLLSIGS